MASPLSGVTFMAKHEPDHKRMVKALLVLLERHAQRAQTEATAHEAPNAPR